MQLTPRVSTRVSQASKFTGLISLPALVLTLVTAPAFAASNNARAASQLPATESTNEPLPTPSTPLSSLQDTGVLRQAGVGSSTAYGRAGVLELGGGLTFSGSQDGTVLALTPIVGWFFADNFQLSGIIQLTHSRIEHLGITSSTTYFTGLIEPSVHIPVVDNLFLFAGLGAGVGYDASRRSAGFALAPRIGGNVLIGRSGILTPSATWNWSSNNAVQTPQGTMVALNSTYGININYTVMW